MKTILFLMMFLWSANLNAQNYLISFTGTGESTTVSTVKVENLNKGTSLTLNGSDVLQLTLVTNVAIVENRGSSRIMIYPNPMTDHTTLVIYPSESGDAAISIYDMTGKLIAQKQFYLDKISNEFILSGFNSGLYLISVRGKAYQYSEKLICQNETNESIHIDKVINRQSFDTDIYNKVSKGTLTTVDMGFSEGDRFKFTGISGNYSTVLIDIPSSDKTIIFNFMTCSDGDNNKYPVLALGTQIWMAENLKTTKYNDGSIIPLVTDNTEWGALNDPGYCWYNNDMVAYKDIFGGLYNWFTVDNSSNGIKNICPIGWHIPTHAEWSTLMDYLVSNGFSYHGINNQIAKAMASTTGWTPFLTPGTIGNDQLANNSSGFTALPGGFRHWEYETFNALNDNGNWWSSSEETSQNAWNVGLSYGYEELGFSNQSKNNGFSVRCVHDN